MTVGQRIRIKRLEQGMSQTDLAKKMGYTSKAAISKVEVNDEDMSLARVKKFADALNVSPGYLMGWSDERGNPNPPKQPDIYHSQFDALVERLNDGQKAQLLAVAKAMFPEL